ncbi:MAG: polyprenyl synthetase family protein [Candidatus Thermoplasmatota archaeon]|jgi:geranylgeranyl diphosphate synthase type I|nr:polyprenyl synthetase family protein [Candidatus Thermoplasmatota archaeon]
MEARELIAAERAMVEGKIGEFFDHESRLCLEDPLARELLDALREYTMRGGKRVRAVMLVLGYLAVGGRDMERARKAAVSMELVQDMLLIHDDLMDRSPERRGGRSLHEHFRAVHRERGYRGDPERFGYNMALIGGDLAESMAEKALLASGFPSRNLVKAMSLQADMVRDTGYGQVLDLCSMELPEWSEDQVLKVHHYKTARYTFEGPLLIGAILHGAPQRALGALSGFAVPIGIAFQLIDDIIGLFGDPKKGGASDISDIREGKRTLLVIDALKKVSEADASMVLNGLGDPDLTLADAARIREIVVASGAVERSRALASELTERGDSSLDGSGLDPTVCEALRVLADEMLGRV